MHRAKQLIDLCSNNAAFFVKDKSYNGQCLHASFLELTKHVKFSFPLLEEICSVAPMHDFDSSVPGNGYRSALSMVDIVISDCITINEQIENKRNALLFPKRRFKREMEVHTQLMKTMNTLLRSLVALIRRSDGELIFAKCQSLEEFFNLGDMTDLACFYGGQLGFQFCKSMRSILRNVLIGMATYDKVYHSKQSAVVRNLHWVWSGGKYVLAPKLRAQKIVNIAQYTSVDFCKSFWMLTENDLLGRMPAMICPKVSVNQVISIPTEPLEHVTSDGRKIQVPIPHSHLEPCPVQARLLSTLRREGMDGSGTAAPPARHLVFHCHGGGFVAQSSRSHEIYLRDWAKQLDMPILSIDYSLAPLAPYPRALEEVVYAYAWALANASRLGTTAEYVILAGDSAGANLCLGLALKCIDLGITPPLGIFLAYVPVLISPAPSPARALSVTDPVVPFGFLLNCLTVYAGTSDRSLSNNTQSAGVLNDTVQNGVHPINNKATNNEIIVVENLQESNGSQQPAIVQEILLDSDGKPSEKNAGVGQMTHGKKGTAEGGPSPFAVFIAGQNMDDPQDPFLSPYWASNETLSKLPPVSIVSLEFDPCLDDCVFFARRLKDVNKKVTLDVLSGLPHGFLNFAMLCKEAHEGSNLCVKRMKELFDVNPPGKTTS